MLRIAFVGLLLMTGFYLITATVYDEGGFGVQLVVKPYPSLSVLAGGGQDGTWQHEHPNQPKPWWLVNNFVPIVVDDWEGGRPWWVEAHMNGFVATMLGWPVLGAAYVFRYLWRRRIGAPQSQLPLTAIAFSIVSVLLTVMAVDFEGTTYGAFLIVCGAVLSFLALVIVVVRRARSGARAGFTLVAVVSFMCLFGLAALVVDALFRLGTEMM
jgi:hypothetical protein